MKITKIDNVKLNYKQDESQNSIYLLANNIKPDNVMTSLVLPVIIDNLEEDNVNEVISLYKYLKIDDVTVNPNNSSVVVIYLNSTNELEVKIVPIIKIKYEPNLIDYIIEGKYSRVSNEYYYFIKQMYSSEHQNYLQKLFRPSLKQFEERAKELMIDPQLLIDNQSVISRPKEESLTLQTTYYNE